MEAPKPMEAPSWTPQAASLLQGMNPGPGAAPEKKESPAKQESPEKKESPEKQETASKPVKRRKFSVTVLQKEMNRWNRLKIADLCCYKLLRLYIGMPEFLDESGIYPMNEIYHISVKIYNKQGRKLLQLIEKSGSFKFLVDTQTQQCVGFFSPATLLLDDLETYHPKNPEFLQLPVVNFCTLQKMTATQKKTTPHNKYYVLDSLTHQDNHFQNPSTKECLTAPGEENSWDQWFVKSASQKKKAPTDYGDAEEFFRQLFQPGKTQKDFLEPQRVLLMRRFHLNREEADIEVGYFIDHYLIPHFNAASTFRSTPFAGRCAWLQHILNQHYIQGQLDDSHRACLDTIAALRRQHAEQQRKAQYEYRPLSAYEWTHPQTGQRYYRDPDDGVIDLPAEAPARPTATARWNPYTRTWTDEATPENPTEMEPTDGIPTDGIPDFDDVFGKDVFGEEGDGKDVFGEERDGEEAIFGNEAAEETSGEGGER